VRTASGIVALLLVVTAANLGAQSTQLIADVRAAIAQQDFARGERIISSYRSARGPTPEMLEALSWLGRGALAAGRLEQAAGYAEDTYELARAALKGRRLDQEPHLPIALGAAIEVQAHVAARRGALSEAISYLQRQLDSFRNTSVHARIQKNINLLSLEGRPAPALDLSEYLGPRPPSLDALKGKVVLLFFWAHWCSDCKQQGPILADLSARYGPDLLIVAPTQRYGYAARGEPATPMAELRHIDDVRRTSYSVLANRPVPVVEANMRRYGVSTTPTLVLLDRAGVVRLYHPGRMTTGELEPIVRRLVRGS
jgi:thiol-disulfide isomerase/thioredoxin